MYLYVYIRCSAATLSLSLQSVQYFFLYHIDGSSDSIFVVVLSFFRCSYGFDISQVHGCCSCCYNYWRVYAVYVYMCVFFKITFPMCVCVFLMYYIENLVLLLLLLFSWSLLTKATSMLLLLLSAASISLCFSIIGNNQSLMSTHFARFLATSSLLINITFCKERKITIEKFK